MTAPDRPSREDRRRELAALPKARLCSMYRTGVYAPNGRVGRYAGGMYPPEQWRKDEVISSILEIEYPAESRPKNS
jgi:hypothetical protein